MKQKTSRGFTLIELLVVIAIIGILASIVLVSLSSARTKARDARRISDIKQIALALETYFSDNAQYPSVSSVSSLPLTTYMQTFLLSTISRQVSKMLQPTAQGHLRVMLTLLIMVLLFAQRAQLTFTVAQLFQVGSFVLIQPT